MAIKLEGLTAAQKKTLLARGEANCELWKLVRGLHRGLNESFKVVGDFDELLSAADYESFETDLERALSHLRVLMDERALVDAGEGDGTPTK